TPLPEISPDAQRRRLIELIKTMALRRSEPVMYVIEDAHWIDSVSESMLAEFAGTVATMRATLLVAYRPEYSGALSKISAAQPFVLAPLNDSQSAELINGLLGEAPSVRSLSAVIA